MTNTYGTMKMKMRNASAAASTPPPLDDVAFQGGERGVDRA